MKSAAVFKDAAESAFADRRSLWWHLGLLTAGPLILFFAWPDASPAEYAARGSGPRSLRIVTMALAVYIFVSSGGWTLDRFQGRIGFAFSRWQRYTPVTAGHWLAGRVGYHLVHTVILVLLALPSLALAGGASLKPPGTILAIAAIIGYTAFGFRLMAEAGRKHEGRHGPLAMMTYLVALVVYFLAGSGVFSDWNLLWVLSALADTASSAGFPENAWKPLLLQGGLGLIGAVLSYFRLRRFGRKEFR